MGGCHWHAAQPPAGAQLALHVSDPACMQVEVGRKSLFGEERAGRGGAGMRRCSARQQSAFMPASLMNERSRFPLTPGRNGAPAPAALLIVRSPLGEEIKLACGRVNEKKTETRPLGFR